MNLHEHQAKAIFAKHGIPIPRGRVVFSIEEVASQVQALMDETGKGVVVVKAQIHAGGRGKGGGVRLARSVEEAVERAQSMWNRPLVTKQTGPEGRVVRRIYLEEGLDLEGSREIYLSLLLDRATRRITIVASAAGGVDIEEVAERDPSKILRMPIDPITGLMPHHARRLGKGLGFSGVTLAQFAEILHRLYGLFLSEDCSLIEVNPLLCTRDGDLMALDAKIALEDNAAFRHPEWEGMRDPNEEDPGETEAKRVGISYVKLDGNIGCLVNGAGLAMATMDIIKHYGGAPANFLDVGGGANENQVRRGFEIILRDPKVRGIFVNIFGGIMRCDTIANGIIGAARAIGLKVPLVVRLEGTNVEKGKAILEASNLPIHSASDMAEGARRIVELVRE
ncbi:MAG: ADP-forming succinate--CoA ligase subunit beta [Sandaracinaceae bacterium]|nr:ADP-forming succinate--CoA ligase subunit beta [Sandaracinaceae bacterium]